MYFVDVKNVCPQCKRVFSWGEGKNKRFYFSSQLDCPGCGARLRNPKTLRSPWTYIKIAAVFVCAIWVLMWLDSAHEYIRFGVGLTLFATVLWWAKWSLGVRGGLITLEAVH